MAPSLVNETFDSVLDADDAEYEEDDLVNQVYDEIGLEFSESVSLCLIVILSFYYV